MADEKTVDAKKKLDELLGGETVVLDDKEVDVEEIRRWRDTRANMEKDYTKKTQELADQKRQVQKTLEEIQPYLDLNDFLAQHPDKKVKLEELMKEDVSRESDTDDPVIKKLTNKINELETKFTSTTEKQELEKEVKKMEGVIAENLKTLSSKYPKADTEVVIAKLIAIPNIDNYDEKEFVDTMELVVKDSHERKVAYDDNIIKSYIANKGKKNTTSEGGGGSVNIDKPEKIVDLKSGEAKERAARIFAESQD